MPEQIEIAVFFVVMTGIKDVNTLEPFDGRFIVLGSHVKIADVDLMGHQLVQTALPILLDLGFLREVGIRLQ